MTNSYDHSSSIKPDFYTSKLHLAVSTEKNTDKTVNPSKFKGYKVSKLDIKYEECRQSTEKLLEEYAQAKLELEQPGKLKRLADYYLFNVNLRLPDGYKINTTDPTQENQSSQTWKNEINAFISEIEKNCEQPRIYKTKLHRFFSKTDKREKELSSHLADVIKNFNEKTSPGKRIVIFAFENSLAGCQAALLRSGKNTFEAFRTHCSMASSLFNFFPKRAEASGQPSTQPEMITADQVATMYANTDELNKPDNTSSRGSTYASLPTHLRMGVKVGYPHNNQASQSGRSESTFSLQIDHKPTSHYKPDTPLAKASIPNSIIPDQFQAETKPPYYRPVSGTRSNFCLAKSTGPLLPIESNFISKFLSYKDWPRAIFDKAPRHYPHIKPKSNHLKESKPGEVPCNEKFLVVPTRTLTDCRSPQRPTKLSKQLLSSSSSNVTNEVPVEIQKSFQSRRHSEYVTDFYPDDMNPLPDHSQSTKEAGRSSLPSDITRNMRLMK